MLEPPLDILAYGEPMVEFNQTGEGGGRLYLQGFGGDSSNFAIAAARQGARVGYFSAVGDDHHGRMLRALWDAEGVDSTSVRTDAAAFTAIYFVTHGPRGHEFHFLRNGSAASRVAPADVPRERIAAAKVLHLSGHLAGDLGQRLRRRLRRDRRRPRGPASRSRSTPTCGSSSGRSTGRGPSWPT